LQQFGKGFFRAGLSAYSPGRPRFSVIAISILLPHELKTEQKTFDILLD